MLIVHGQDRPIGNGERLAWIEWMPSAAESQSVARFCSGELIKAQFPPDRDGWHSFAVEHLGALTALAKTHTNVTFHPRQEMVARQPWTADRIAWFGFRVGQGDTAKRIAEDPLINTSEGNVWRQAHRFGLALSAKTFGQIVLRRIPAASMAILEAAAGRAGVTRETYASRLLVEALGRQDPPAIVNA